MPVSAHIGLGPVFPEGYLMLSLLVFPLVIPTPPPLFFLIYSFMICSKELVWFYKDHQP